LFGFRHVLLPLLTDEQLYTAAAPKAKPALEKWLNKHQSDAILTTQMQVPDESTWQDGTSLPCREVA
jgi:hypothetical protein